MSARRAGADVATKGALTVTDQKTPCPNCGLIAPGVRCPRCNTMKLMACTGSCSTCKSKCG